MTELNHSDEKSCTQILVVAAHPDDAEFTCAGTLAKRIREGCQVHYIVCTSGDKGSKDPDMTPHQVAMIREQEQRAAARVLGVHDVTFLRHEDGEIEATKAFRAEIAMLIRRYRPDIVFTHDAWQPYQLHPDHRAVGITTCDAIISARDHLFLASQTAIALGPVEPRALYLWSPLEVDYVEDITETMEVKIAALRQHASQLRRPNWEERVRQRAAEAGAARGFAYGEGFKLIAFG